MMQEETATATATDSASVFLPQPQPQLRYVDHTYKDFSTYFKEGGRLQKHKKCERNFPARLHAMLSDEQCSHIISWMPHGRSWKVRDKKLLIEEAIPKHFGQSNYTSFARQLSGWGFKRLRKLGPDNGSYYHECFLQGQPRLTVLMRRIYPGRGKATPNIEGEPDFYLISKQFPLHTAETYTEPPPAAVYSYSEPKLDGKKEESGDTVIDSSPQEVMNFEPLPLSSHSIFDSVAMAATSRCETSVNQFHARGVNQYLGKAPQQDGTELYTQPESHYHYMAKPPTLTPTTTESGNLQDESATLNFFKSLFDDDDDSWTKMISSPSRTIRNDDKR